MLKISQQNSFNLKFFVGNFCDRGFKVNGLCNGALLIETTNHEHDIKLQKTIKPDSNIFVEMPLHLPANRKGSN